MDLDRLRRHCEDRRGPVGLGLTPHLSGRAAEGWRDRNLARSTTSTVSTTSAPTTSTATSTSVEVFDAVTFTGVACSSPSEGVYAPSSRAPTR